MEADIKLGSNAVVVEATDLILDAHERRSNEEGYRRALVHGENDSLILNYKGDYPGGVTIMGRLFLAGPYPQTTQGIGSTTSGKGGLPPFGGGNIPDREWLRARTEPDIPEMLGKRKMPLNLLGHLAALETAILSLDRRLKAIEGKS